MWQDLFDGLRDENFMVVAVAEETRGAEHARSWIEQAHPDYWCLIDTDHHVADLYGMVNVPQAVWIDEAGRIARPPENAGSSDHFRRMDRVSKTMSAEDQAARHAARATYFDAVRDWVRTGKHALPADVVQRNAPRITQEIAQAQANFRLGVWLYRNGHAAAGAGQLAEASRLHPDSWTIWRQAADLDEIGKAGGEAFWRRVDALGDRPYYPPPDL